MKKLSGGQQTRYIGGDYEIENNGTITKYLAGGKKRSNNFFIHHKDHLGSIQVVTNSAGWQVLRQKHKPFGDQHDVVGWHTESKGWIGEREEETELVYLNARYYDPEIGRFTAPDPFLTLGQGLNRFSYAWNNPINVSDPTGLLPDDGSDDGYEFDLATGSPLDWINFFRFIGDLFAQLFGGGGGCCPTRPDGVPPDRAEESMDGDHVESPYADYGDDNGTSVPPVVEPPPVTPKCPSCLDPDPIPRPIPPPPLVNITDGVPRMGDSMLGYNEITYGGYDVYIGGTLVDGNVLGSEAHLDPFLNWHEGAWLTASTPPIGPGKALKAARAGARHAGQLRQFMKQTPQQLQKSLNSFKTLVARHHGWIKNPASKVPNWNSLSLKHQQDLLRHWWKDVARHEEFISMIEDLMKGL